MTRFLFLLTFLLSLFVHSSVSDPRDSEAALICGNKTTSPSDLPSFSQNFIHAMSSIIPTVTSKGFVSKSNGSGSSTVYIFAQCMKDLSLVDCNLCLQHCNTRILGCQQFENGTRAGRLFLDGCYLRYDDHEFLSETFSAEDKILCGPKNFTEKMQFDDFSAMTVDLLGKLSTEAPKNGGFQVGALSRGNLSVHGLAQCWEYMNASACEKCLASGVSNINPCLSKEEGRVLNAGCYIRYSTYRFYYNSKDYALADRLGGGELGVAVFLLLLSFLMIITH